MIEELITKSSQELNDKGYSEIGLSFSFDESILTVQVKDKKIVENNKNKIGNNIMDIAKEIKFVEENVIVFPFKVVLDIKLRVILI